MATVLISVLLILICVYAVYSYIQKLRRGGGCCGDHEPAEKRVRVADRDRTHYPYMVTLNLDGMTCGNCVRRVENALNRIDGVWAEADLAGQKAVVRTKNPPDEELLRQAVRDAGYTMLSMEKNG